MNAVTVRASRQYDILIGQGLLPTLGAEAKKLGKAQKVCVISETTVYPLYGAVAEESLKSAGFSVVSYVFPAGEESKNGLIFLDLLNFLAENRLTRSDMIVALGGGVVGDLAGFAAASYLRGIRFIQVPTTLLAAVDSSVGGKTAIDLPAGKNLAGAFCQPSLVLCDTDTLNSLPLDIFRDGCAEVIKAAMLKSHTFFEDLDKTPPREQLEHILEFCIAMKRDVVEEDEFDTGERILLNFGHTLAHTIEQHFHYERESHGEAVAIGMYQITKIAEEKGLTKKGEAEHIRKVLEAYKLPVKADVPLPQLTEAIKLDKKTLNNKLKVVLLHEIGDSYTYPTGQKFFDGDRMV